MSGDVYDWMETTCLATNGTSGCMDNDEWMNEWINERREQIYTKHKTHKHTNTQTHKHTNTQTHKHTNTQTRKHTQNSYVLLISRTDVALQNPG